MKWLLALPPRRNHAGSHPAQPKNMRAEATAGWDSAAMRTDRKHADRHVTAEPVGVVASPLRTVLLSQWWCDLAFLHWFVPPERVLGHLPPGTRPDVVEQGPHSGRTPVALVPFRMVGSGPGHGPPVPYLGTFWETNVRLYSVDARGRRGVVFASLDASRLAVVLAARYGLGLPYRWSRMRGVERRRDGARELAWRARDRWPGPRRVRR